MPQAEASQAPFRTPNNKRNTLRMKTILLTSLSALTLLPEYAFAVGEAPPVRTLSTDPAAQARHNPASVSGDRKDELQYVFAEGLTEQADGTIVLVSPHPVP